MRATAALSGLCRGLRRAGRAARPGRPDTRAEIEGRGGNQDLHVQNQGERRHVDVNAPLPGDLRLLAAPRGALHDGGMKLADRWPELPYVAWKETAATLQLWTQIVGKVRLALTPWLNHSWHVALYVTARGLTTSAMPAGARTLQIDFDFVDHLLWLRTSDGHSRQILLKPTSVAEFYEEVMLALSALSIAVRIRTMPCEIADGMPFDEDIAHAAYDGEYAQRFWRVLASAHEVFAHFRTGFLGKASPVHFFWGSFDLAVTRFSGRRAPRHPGGVPHLPN